LESKILSVALKPIHGDEKKDSIEGSLQFSIGFISLKLYLKGPCNWVTNIGLNLDSRPSLAFALYAKTYLSFLIYTRVFINNRLYFNIKLIAKAMGLCHPKR
jgi:hypothetical protein